MQVVGRVDADHLDVVARLKRVVVGRDEGDAATRRPACRRSRRSRTGRVLRGANHSRCRSGEMAPMPRPMTPMPTVFSIIACLLRAVSTKSLSVVKRTVLVRAA